MRLVRMAALLAAALVTIACGAGARTAETMPGPTNDNRADKKADKKMKMILDTDIGDDIDDAYALALIATRPNVQLLGVTTAFGQTHERAEVAAKLLKAMGRTDVPVYAGRRGPSQIREQYAWAKGYSAPHLKSGEAVEFLRQTVERYPGEVTLVAIGPLTNLGDLLTKYPETKSKIKRIVIMGGAVHVGYNNAEPPVVEWNIKCDPAAAKRVYGSGVPLVMAGLEVTTMMKLEADRQKRLYAYGTPMTDALAALTALWGGGVPTLFDPVAVAYAVGEAHCEAESGHVVVDDDGMTRLTDGPANCTVLVRPQKDAFLDWYVEALRPAH